MQISNMLGKDGGKPLPTIQLKQPLKAMHTCMSDEAKQYFDVHASTVRFVTLDALGQTVQRFGGDMLHILKQVTMSPGQVLGWLQPDTVSPCSEGGGRLAGAGLDDPQVCESQYQICAIRSRQCEAQYKAAL